MFNLDRHGETSPIIPKFVQSVVFKRLQEVVTNTSMMNITPEVFQKHFCSLSGVYIKNSFNPCWESTQSSELMIQTANKLCRSCLLEYILHTAYRYVGCGAGPARTDRVKIERSAVRCMAACSIYNLLRSCSTVVHLRYLNIGKDDLRCVRYLEICPDIFSRRQICPKQDIVKYFTYCKISNIS